MSTESIVGPGNSSDTIAFLDSITSKVLTPIPTVAIESPDPYAQFPESLPEPSYLAEPVAPRETANPPATPQATPQATPPAVSGNQNQLLFDTLDDMVVSNIISPEQAEVYRKAEFSDLIDIWGSKDASAGDVYVSGRLLDTVFPEQFSEYKKANPTASKGISIGKPSTWDGQTWMAAAILFSSVYGGWAKGRADQTNSDREYALAKQKLQLERDRLNIQTSLEERALALKEATTPKPGGAVNVPRNIYR